MHPSVAFRETDEAALRALVAGRGFGLVIGAADGRPVVAHAALLLEGRTLRFHLSRANALTPVLETGGTALVVVSGADAYVSPDWYGLDDQVPTWNYLSVEMEGPVTPLDDAAAAVLLDDLSAYFEARLAPKAPWTREKMTPGRFEALLHGIRAFEMRVDRFEGTTKLSQNKPKDAMTAPRLHWRRRAPRRSPGLCDPERKSNFPRHPGRSAQRGEPGPRVTGAVLGPGSSLRAVRDDDES